MTNATRMKLERAIVATLIREAKRGGFVPVQVWQDGEYAPVTDAESAIEATFAVDTATIHFAPKGNPDDWGSRGVLIVGGNGEDVISDWHCGDDRFNAAVERAVKRIENLQVHV